MTHRPNLTVMTHAEVHRLEGNSGPEGFSVDGVWVGEKGGAPRLISARREVILAAGSVASPHILQHSGIGPGDHLSSYDIPCHVDSQGVGHGLQDHLQIRTIYKVQNTVTLNQRVNSLWGKAMMGLEYLFFKTGPLTMPPSQLGAFAKSDESQPSANIEWHVQPLSLDQFGSPLHSFNAITPSVPELGPLVVIALLAAHINHGVDGG